MLLALDIGNTTIAYGLFDGGKLKKTGRVVSPHKLPFADFAKVSRVVVASVVPRLNPVLRRLVLRRLKIIPHFVTYKDIRMKITLKNKNEIGIDRLVDAYAADQFYGGPLLVVDFGTAATFCAVSEDGKYLGGAIAPGIGMARDALHEKTAKLPKIAVKVAGRTIGKNTVSAMQAGIYIGYIGLVKELVARMKNEMATGSRPVKIIATGGNAKLISRGVKFDIIEETLTLRGLNLIGRTMDRSHEGKNVRRIK